MTNFLMKNTRKIKLMKSNLMKNQIGKTDEKKIVEDKEIMKLKILSTEMKRYIEKNTMI